MPEHCCIETRARPRNFFDFPIAIYRPKNVGEAGSTDATGSHIVGQQTVNLVALYVGLFANIKAASGRESFSAEANEEVAKQTYELRIRYSPTFTQLDTKCVVVSSLGNMDIKSVKQEPIVDPDEIVLRAEVRADSVVYTP